MAALNIAYLHREEIDDERWDRVVTASGHETVYAHSWYLDACADQWGALITDSYDSVMPLVFRKKMGIKYLYQPRFCQQLGVYSEKDVDEVTMDLFIRAVIKRFKLGEFALNEGNFLGNRHGLEVTERTNFILQLLPDHETLVRGYTTNCRRNLQKAEDSGLVFSDDIPVEELVLLKKAHDHLKHADSHYRHLIRMFGSLKRKGDVKAVGVKLDGVLCAGAMIAGSTKRIHYLLSVSDQAGREKHGMFMVIDRLIQKHAGRPMLLDFEGSNNPSIARFFRGFGAQPHIYQRICLNGGAVRFVQKIKNRRRHAR